MKVIINTDISIEDAIDSVKEVIDDGLVSNGTYGAQYCFATVWTSGVRVEASKTKNGTHTFRVWKSEA
jgi:hypothetical protein